MFKNILEKFHTFITRSREAMTATRKARIWGWVVSALYVCFIFFLIEMHNYRSIWQFCGQIIVRPINTLLGFLITILIYLFFTLICKKIWLGALLTGILYQICAWVNYLKVDLNGDPFVPWDLAMTDNMGELMSFVKVTLSWWSYLLTLLLIAYIFVLWLWQKELPIKWYLRLPLSVIIPIALVLFIHPDHARANLKLFHMQYEDAALQSSNYDANGFIGGFYLNLASMSVDEPENYSKESVEALLAAHDTTPATAKPDVIVILCESYWDIRKLPGTTFSTDPMYFYDALCERENAYSGTIYTTALGGGTVRPEFGVLTGLSTDFLPPGTSPYHYVLDDVETAVSAYKADGYTTIAMHPYDPTFYSRSKAYPYLAFDAYYGHDEIIEMVEETYERGYVSDDSFVDAMIAQLEENEDTPTFLWGISMENHQTFYPLEEYDIDVQNPALEGELLGTVNTYAQGVYHSTKALEKLVNYIDSREKDTLLVFFGDHLPTLGGNYAAYTATGLFDSSDTSLENRKTMYGTPFVIYGNYELSDGVLTHKDNELSDYYLLSAAATVGGMKRTPYMNWLLEQYQKVPYYSPRLCIEPTREINEFLSGQKLITYDRLVGKRYSVDI